MHEENKGQMTKGEDTTEDEKEGQSSYESDINHHPSPVGRVRTREETMTEKRKDQEETPSGLYQMGRRSEWEECAFFFRLYADVTEMRVGIQ